MFRKEPALWILEFYYVMNHSYPSSPVSLPHLEDVPHGLPLAAPFIANSQQYWTPIGKHRKVSSWELDEVGRCQQRTRKQQLSFASTGRRAAQDVCVLRAKCCETESTVTWKEGAPNSVFSCTVSFTVAGVFGRDGSGLLKAQDLILDLVSLCFLWWITELWQYDHKWSEVTRSDSCGMPLLQWQLLGVLLRSSADSKYLGTFNKLRASHCWCSVWGIVKAPVAACSWPHLQHGLWWEPCPSVHQHRACPEHCRERQNWITETWWPSSNSAHMKMPN